MAVHPVSPLPDWCAELENIEEGFGDCVAVQRSRWIAGRQRVGHGFQSVDDWLPGPGAEVDLVAEVEEYVFQFLLRD